MNAGITSLPPSMILTACANVTSRPSNTILQDDTDIGYRVSTRLMAPIVSIASVCAEPGCQPREPSRHATTERWSRRRAHDRRPLMTAAALKAEDSAPVTLAGATRAQITPPSPRSERPSANSRCAPRSSGTGSTIAARANFQRCAISRGRCSTGWRSIARSRGLKSSPNSFPPTAPASGSCAWPQPTASTRARRSNASISRSLTGARFACRARSAAPSIARSVIPARCRWCAT